MSATGRKRLRTDRYQALDLIHQCDGLEVRMATAASRVRRYSGKYRPACLISQTGGRSVGSPASARSSNFLGAIGFLAFEFSSAASI